MIIIVIEGLGVMKTDATVSEHLAEYMYVLDSIRHFRSDCTAAVRKSSLYGMLLCGEGGGEFAVDGHSRSLLRNRAYLLPPHAAVHLRTNPHASADCYYIHYHILKGGEQQRLHAVEVHAPVEFDIAPIPYVIDRAREAERQLRGGDRLGAMKANIAFQEMMLALFEHSLLGRKPSADEAIRQTMDYMRRNFRSPISREKLAEMAGMSADYYSRAFKKLTGKRPMEYLTELRIGQAQQLLLESRSPFRSVAQSVGFSDEFYFSRKFKAATGRSPAAFVKTMRSPGKIASLKHLLTGHLLALGIEPYAAVINNVYPVTARLSNTISVGEADPELDKLMEAKPDIIVTRELRDFKHTERDKLYGQIAPTVKLPFFEDWRVHLRTIAKIVGREHEADRWLDRYEHKAEAMRKRIRGRLGDESVLIVGVGEGRMCIYGRRNLGAVLYGDLALTVPDGVAGIDHYKEISADDLPAFAAERIVLTSFKHDGTPRMDETIRGEMNALFASEGWRDLKAVRDGAVHYLYDSSHLYTCYTSYSHDLLLDRVYRLFEPGSST